MAEQDPERQEPADEDDKDDEQDEIEVSDLDVEEDELTTSVTGGMLENPSAGGEVKRTRP